MDTLEDVTQPVSPSGRFFNTQLLCAYVFGFLESEVPIEFSQANYLFQHVFLPVNPRFSSIMVRDERGEMKWKRVEVKSEDHIKVPTFPENESLELYDQYFDDYVSMILMERTPQDKPLWEIHVIKYPTSNAAGTLIFKLHHALGDGYSLVGALLSCLQRADDPSLPLSFPSRKSSASSPPSKKCFFLRFPPFSTMLSCFNSIKDFGWSIVKSSIVEDDKTPIRSGEEGVESLPCVLWNISFSLDEVKKIKSKLGVTVNDVITGVIFYGIRLYMQDIDVKAGKANSTGLVMLSTRNIGSYQSIQEMMKGDSESAWGNHISFLHVPIPKLSQGSSNPLEFVWKAQKIIKRKRSSFTVYLIEWLLDMELKLRGHEAVAKHIYGTLRNSSVVVSNLIGPMEPMVLANHPVKGLYFTMSGGPESINIAVISYTRTLRITLKTQKGFIDEKKFKFFIVKAFEVISKAALEIPSKNKG
ncbi:hypothetical protein Fmac_021624 [Flemingia macrophylla]|uniref:Diacylglycerol O-acyltransferase n=1 Tax=Flemingia macrophylla TaxID=520843 RepID=A0ABD1LXE7_9FABA